MGIDRRTLILSAPVLAVASPALAKARARGQFTHGVASGDPTSSAVILWTRFVPDGAGAAAVGWEVSEDEAFTQVRRRGEAAASPLNDHCVKVDARGLMPGRRYYYRFLAASGASPTGITRTAPSGGVESMSFALFSCANKPFGYFHPYAHAAARDDIDLNIHVGDYIYEYPRGVYPYPDEVIPNRVIEPATELLSFSDYHARYASYRNDPVLQELHRVRPMVAVWDDHELANDTWKDGAENHQPESEGAWSVRRAVAAKAFRDWLPIRDQGAPLMISRRFDWGDLATLIMLDTRLIGRDRQLDWRTTLGRVAEGGPSALAAAARALGEGPLNDPARTLLGAPQEAWLTRELTRSKARGATWQILGQQIVMGRQLMPAANAAMLAPDARPGTKQWVAGAALVGNLGYGWNLDSWGGYPRARERFLQACATHANNALVLSGDSHNAWANNLPGGAGGRPAAIEMAGTSVSSPGFEHTFVAAAPGGREAAMRAANAELAWCDMTNRGYCAARLTRERVEVEWVACPGAVNPVAAAPRITRSSAEATRDHGVSPWSFS